MKKNNIIAFILIAIIFGGGLWLQSVLYQKERAKMEAAGISPEVQQTMPPQVSEQALEQVQANEGAPIVSKPDNAENETDQVEKTFVVETDMVRATFSNKGGDLISYKLKQHRDSRSSENVEMLKNLSDANRAFAISLGGYASPILNNIFSVSEKTGDKGEKGISFTANIAIQNKQGALEYIKLSKHYLFIPGEYMFELVVTIEGGENFSALNYGNASYTIRSFPQIGPDWNKNDRYDFRRFSAYVDGKKKDRVLRAGEVKSVEGASVWTAVSGKYFAFAMIPDKLGGTVTYSTDNSNTSFNTENTQFFISQAPMTGSSLQHSYKIYLGPTSDKYLNRYTDPLKNGFNFGNLGLETLASNSGFFAPLIVVLNWLLQFVYNFVHNWGIAIILVTVFIRLLLLPLSVKTMVGTQKLQPYQASIAEIQKKYRSNPQKMQEEMTKIYDMAGYRPGCASGCLPLVLQFAVIIAMFQLFNNYFEFRGASFIPGWISDLSIGDSVYHFKNPLPLLAWTDIRLLPIIYIITQYLSTLLTKQQNQPKETQSMMFVMMYIMPAVFFFMLYNAPSGLFVFWITSNILMVFQQFITNAMVKKELAKDKK